LEVYKEAKKMGYIDGDNLVLVVSAEARAQKIDELYKEGIYEFVPKPIRVKKFTEVLNNAIAKIS
jgi:DNA-binding NtrC family response regulator